MISSRSDPTTRRRQLKLQCFNEMVESAQRVAADSINFSGYSDLQHYAHQRQDHGMDFNPATTEAQLRLSTNDLNGSADCAVEQVILPETDDLSVPLSARLFGDYTYHYDEYLD